MSLDDIQNLQSYAIGRIAKTISDYTSGNKDAKTDVHGNFLDDSTPNIDDNTDAKLYNDGLHTIRLSDQLRNRNIWHDLKDFSDTLELEWFLQHDRDVGLAGPETTYNQELFRIRFVSEYGSLFYGTNPFITVSFSNNKADNENFKMIFTYNKNGLRTGTELQYKFKYTSGRYKLQFRKNSPHIRLFINDELIEPETYVVGNSLTEVPPFFSSFWVSDGTQSSPAYLQFYFHNIQGFLDDIKITKDGVVFADFSGSENQTYIKHFKEPKRGGINNYIPSLLDSEQTKGYTDKTGNLTGAYLELGSNPSLNTNSYIANSMPINPKIHGFNEIPTFAKNLKPPRPEGLTTFTEDGLPNLDINPSYLEDKNRAFMRYKSTTGSLSSKSLQPVIAQNSSGDLSFPGAVGSSESVTDIEWNPDCWYYKKAMTCFSVTSQYHSFAGKATLLSPRHAIMATHVFNDYNYDRPFVGSGVSFQNPNAGYFPAPRTLTFMDLSGNSQSTLWNDFVKTNLSDAVIIHLRDEITIDVAYASFMTQEDLEKGTKLINPGCGPSKEGYWVCEENVGKTFNGVLDHKGVNLSASKYVKWSRFNNKVGPSHGRVGDSSTPSFIFNGDTLYLSHVALNLGTISEPGGINRYGIYTNYSLLNGLSSSEAKYEIQRAMNVLSTRNSTGICSLKQVPVSGTSKQRLHWDGQGFVALRQPLHLEYMSNTRNGRISFSYKKDSGEIFHKGSHLIDTSPFSGNVVVNGVNSHEYADHFSYFTHDLLSNQGGTFFAMNHIPFTTNYTGNLSSYTVGMGSFWETGRASGSITFSGLQSKNIPSGWFITRKDHHAVDPYMVGENIHVATTGATSAIVWCLLDGARSENISAGTKFNLNWRGDVTLDTNKDPIPTSELPISAITPTVTALTDFKTDVKSAYTSKTLSQKGFISVVRDLGTKIVTSPSFATLMRKTPYYIGTFPLSSGDYTLTFGTTGTKLYRNNQEVQVTTITGSHTSASDYQSLMSSADISAGNAVESLADWPGPENQYDTRATRNRMTFAFNLHGICDNLAITGDANIGFDYTQSLSSHVYNIIETSGQANYYYDSVNSFNSGSGVFVNKATDDGGIQLRRVKYLSSISASDTSAFAHTGFAEGLYFENEGASDMGHNSCPQYINDYNFVENFDTRKSQPFVGIPSSILSGSKSTQQVTIKAPTIYDKAYLRYKNSDYITSTSLSANPKLSGMPIIIGYENGKFAQASNNFRSDRFTDIKYISWPRHNSTSGVSGIERNPDCWYYKKPMTCFSVYGNLHAYNTHMTLLSPRHAIMALHVLDDFHADTAYGGAFRANKSNGYKYTLTSEVSAFKEMTTQQVLTSRLSGRNVIKQGIDNNRFAYFMDLTGKIQKGIIADFVAGTHPDDPGGHLTNHYEGGTAGDGYGTTRNGVPISGHKGDPNGTSFHDMAVVLLESPITLNVDYATFMKESDIDTLSASNLLACGPSKEGIFALENTTSDDLGTLNCIGVSDKANPLFAYSRFANRDAHYSRVGDSSSPGFLYKNNTLYLTCVAKRTGKDIYSARTSHPPNVGIGGQTLVKGIQGKYARNWIQNAMNYLSDINSVPRHDLVIVPLSAT